MEEMPKSSSFFHEYQLPIYMLLPATSKSDRSISGGCISDLSSFSKCVLHKNQF